MISLVFSSAIFIFVFLPAVFIAYRLLPGTRAKNIFLAAASVVFYAFGQLTYVPLFIISVLINYAAGIYLRGERAHRKAALILAVILNLGILAVFKYTDFVISNVNSALSLSIASPGIILPIGISFFTFQGLSYTIDVYRDKSTATRSFMKLLLYIAFFPQLIAGPIVKYHDIAEQIDKRECSPEHTEKGIRRFITGLFKKIIIANAMGYIADAVFGGYLKDAALIDWRLAWLGGICYMLQIYFDFSGYSDMAIGMAGLFGFSIQENFNYPYGASSIREFWRKWHISLSTWFREYLYIPLGGNRRGKWHAVFNRMLVFLCTGIWHGANWTFIVWGVGHGVLSSLEGMKVIPVDALSKSALGRVINKIYTLLAVMLLFVVFRADSLTDAGRMIVSMFSFACMPDSGVALRRLLTPAAVTVLAIAVITAGNLVPRVKSALRRIYPDGSQIINISADILSLLLFAVSVMSLAGGGFNPFIYFQF